jgi:hypothetical protein
MGVQTGQRCVTDSLLLWGRLVPVGVPNFHRYTVHTQRQRNLLSLSLVQAFMLLFVHHSEIAHGASLIV